MQSGRRFRRPDPISIPHQWFAAFGYFFLPC